jgi:quercetin dioxygenase-like cupin family protein
MKRSHVKMLGIGAAALLTSVIGLSRLPAPSIAADATKETCQPAMLHAGEMKWMDTPALAKGLQVAILYGDLKKAEPVGFRIKLPAGGIMAPHTHPVVERVTVISGTFAMGHGETFDKSKLRELPVGSVAIFPTGCPMFGFAKDETIIQVNAEGPWGINYVNPDDDPRKQK